MLRSRDTARSLLALVALVVLLGAVLLPEPGRAAAGDPQRGDRLLAGSAALQPAVVPARSTPPQLQADRSVTPPPKLLLIAPSIEGEPLLWQDARSALRPSRSPQSHRTRAPPSIGSGKHGR